MMESFSISKKVQALELSPTLALNTAVSMLKTQGVDLISLAAGEPDLQPPPVLIEALRKATTLSESFSYSASSGLPDLRKAIVSG